MDVRASRQLFLIALALALWSTLGRPGWLELLACYLAALVLTDVASGVGLLPSLPARAWLVLAVLLALPGLRFAYNVRERVVEQAGLLGTTQWLRDRWRLAQTPTIVPGLVSTAEPQSFFIRADSRALSLVLDDELRLPGQPLGAGLFRVDYDPRRDGVPKPLEGELPIRIETDSGAVSRSLLVVTPLPHPRWFCRSPRGDRAATPSEETDELVVIDVRAGAPLRLAMGDGPLDCAFINEHTIAVSHRHAPELWVVDLAASPVATHKLTLDAPVGRLAWDAARSELLVARLGAEPGLWQLSWPALKVKAVYALPVAGDWLALSDDALFITSRSDAGLQRWVREGSGLVAREKIELGRPASTLLVAADRVFVTVTDHRPAHSPPQLGNHFVQDQLLVIDAHSLALEQRVLTARRSERQTKPGDVDQGGSPLGVWPMADGRLAVAFAGTDELWKLSLPSAEPERTRLGDEFFTPHGVVELADGTLWMASPAQGALAKLAAGASAAQVIALSPSDDTLQRMRPEALARRLGERGFYESTRSGISCQSCHMHADSDFAAYNLGDHRLIPPLSVRGILGTAPYLRDGSYPRVGDLDDVAQGLYRGYVRQQPGRRYALQAYVESLPRAAAARPRADEAGRRGYAVFRRAGCERCHSPPAFTNLGQLPLAAIFPRAAAGLATKEQLDVPSLLSVSSSAPYLHDGRASTLRAVISEQNPDNLHGNTRELSDADQADLVWFLESL